MLSNSDLYTTEAADVATNYNAAVQFRDPSDSTREDEEWSKV